MKDYEYNCILLPYVLQKLDDDIGGWIILNRKYKILGTTSLSHQTVAPKIFRLSSGVNDALRHFLSRGFEDPVYEDKMYLFNDTCSPLSKNASKEHREQYVSKLCMLSSLKTVDNQDVYYLLLPAIDRVNKWGTEWKIVGRGQAQKTRIETMY